MQKSKIEWTEYTANPVTGECPVKCSFCYMTGIRRRFHLPDEIAFHKDVLDKIERHKKPARIFMGSVIELFHDLTIQYLPRIMETVKRCPQHTFIFLTKCPENLPREWPDNCWVGVSVTSAVDAIVRIPKLHSITAPVKFVSFEPLLKPIASPNQLYMMLKLSGINWVIIGQQTPVRASTMPKVEWIKEIVAAADAACTPVFLKDNLRDLLIEDGCALRQELPDVTPKPYWGLYNSRSMIRLD